MIKRWLTLAAVALFLTGCYHQANLPQSTSMPTPTPQTQTFGSTVEIKNFAFTPAIMTVKPGAKITVTNQDAIGHSFTSDDGKSFDTGVLAQGKSISVTAPATAGSYPFHCTPHPYMKGTLSVEE